MNLAPIFDAVATLAGAVIIACVPIVTFKVTSWLGVKMDSEHRDSLNMSVSNAVGEALKVGQTAGDKALSNVTIKNAALNAAVAYVNANASDAVAHFGLTDETIAQKVSNKLAIALHESPVSDEAPTPEVAKTAAMLDKIEAAKTDPIPPAVSTPVPIQTVLTSVPIQTSLTSTPIQTGLTGAPGTLAPA